MKRLLHVNGAPVVDDRNILSAGPRGPALLQDVWLLEKLAHFGQELIPERRMHARGAGAFGRFTLTHSLARHSRARLFANVGQQTEVFVRFSTANGERGAADAERDIRGFAIKFYTEEGNWDLVGQNTPVFYLRDPLRFPDLSHAMRRDPRSHLPSARNRWELLSTLPEALHQLTHLMGDRGLPASYRHMHGYGGHTYSLYDSANRRSWVKFTWRSQQGLRHFSDAEAATVMAQDRDAAQRDLFDAIERGDFPRWTLYVQLMSERQAAVSLFNPFDLTQVWPRALFPLIEVGELELNRNPDNYFADVEQAAFSPAHVVPGLGFSPDKMLQARLFAYGEAQRYRLGVNYHQVPVNAPRCPFHCHHRDGAMRVDGNPGAQPQAGLDWGGREQAEPPLPLGGAAARWDHRVEVDDQAQPRALFQLMTREERRRLFDNTARSLREASAEARQRHIEHCSLADQAYGAGVAAALARLD